MDTSSQGRKINKRGVKMGKAIVFVALLLLSSVTWAKSHTFHINKVTKLGAKYLTIKKYGKNIRFLSNRRIRSCQRVVIKTKAGTRETLKYCTVKKAKKKWR